MTTTPYFDLVIRNGTCLIMDNNSNFKSEPLDLGIANGKIEKIGSIPDKNAKTILDARNLHILPGVIDSQVHFRDPGLEHKEDLFTGTKAAALGGVTTVYEMPNTKPPTINANELKHKISLCRDRIWVNCGFYVGATIDNTDSLAELEKLDGCVGVKMFMGLSTGPLLVKNDTDVEKVLRAGKRRVAIHAEDDERLEERKRLLGENPTVHQHPVWRDVESALKATQRATTIAKKCGRPIHLLHITSAEEITFLSNQKKYVSVECTPQHLTLFAPDCYNSLDTFAQMNPPIREQRHLIALWDGIKNGTIDVIGSDHAPHTREEKQKKYPESPSGMTGVQTLLPIMLDHVNARKLSIEKLTPLISYNPAKLFGLKNKGLIRVGYDADLTIVDLKTERTISNDWIASKCGWTPFNGKKVVGWPKLTIISGNIIMQEDRVLGNPQGQVVSFDTHA